MDAPLDFPMFPPLEANRTGMLPVDELHTLYWGESGNPDGLPVAFVHGGPGGSLRCAHLNITTVSRHFSQCSEAGRLAVIRRPVYRHTAIPQA